MKLNKYFFKSVGFYILSLYIFLTYIPQIFFHIFLHRNFLIHYNAANYNPFVILIIIIFFYFSLFLVLYILPKISINLVLSKNTVNLLNLVSTVLVLMFFFFSFYFMSKYNISFRSSHRLREVSFIVKILIFLKEFVWFYVFIQFVRVIRGYKLNLLIKFNLLLILLGWIFSLTASQSIPLILIILFLLKENTFFKFITYKLNLFKFLFFSIIILFVVIVAVFFGYADKWGFERTYEYFTNPNLLFYIITHTLTRLSTSFEATLELFFDHIQDFNLQLAVIQGFIDNFLYRLSLITHLFSYHLEQINTINRINFFVLFTPLHWHLAFAGASPGLLASIFYIPFFPFNFFIMSFYVVVILRALNKYIFFKYNYFNIFGKLIIFYFNFKLFEAPLDFFYIIEPKFLYILLFIIGSFFFNSCCKQKLLDGGKNVEKMVKK